MFWIAPLPYKLQVEAATSLIFFVPLEKLDLHLVSIVYTRGDYAAVMPNYSYYSYYSPTMLAQSTTEAINSIGVSEVGTWREVLRWIAAPGFLISLVLLFALPEPRNAKGPTVGGAGSPATRAIEAAAKAAKEQQELIPGFLALLKSPAFITTTLAAALNDVGSYALIAWQSTFYERVYHLQPSVYAATLAAVLPIGGIIGGVGGGWAADRLGPLGLRWV